LLFEEAIPALCGFAFHSEPEAGSVVIEGPIEHPRQTCAHLRFEGDCPIRNVRGFCKAADGAFAVIGE